MKMYLDGVVSVTTYSQTGSVRTGSSEHEKIGKERTNYMDGHMKEFIVWDRALTQPEATDLSTKQLAGTDINP